MNYHRQGQILELTQQSQILVQYQELMLDSDLDCYCQQLTIHLGGLNRPNLASNSRF